MLLIASSGTGTEEKKVTRVQLTNVERNRIYKERGRDRSGHTQDSPYCMGFCKIF